MMPSGSPRNILVETVRRSESMACMACRAVYLARFFEILAECLYPELGRRQRAARLFEISVSWPDKTRVSVPQLKLHLEAMFSPEERSRSRLYKQVCSQTRGDALELPAHQEPFYYQWEEEAGPEEVTALLMTRWLSLLGAFCHLAVQNPERAHECASAREQKEPHYQIRDGVLHLSFPAPFLQMIAADCLVNLALRKDFLEIRASAEEKISADFEARVPEDFGHPG